MPLPDTPAGKEAARVLEILNKDEDSTAADWEGTLDEAFTRQVPVEALLKVINQQMRPARQFTATEVHEAGEQQVSLRLANALPQDLQLDLGLDETGKISTLLFTPAPDTHREKLASLKDLSNFLDQQPGTIRGYIASLDGEDIVLDRESDQPAPLGSMFKLYVLQAVADAIQAGDLSWDDELVLEDADKSLPSGELQDQPAGTKVSVFDAAMGMISISDNTATDLLIDKVGREAVEAAVKKSGHHDPQEMQPFLRTKDVFMLAWGDEKIQKQWNNADTAQRTSLLKKLQAEDFNLEASDISQEPQWPAGAEWFASPQDIAGIHQLLDASKDPKIHQILAKNPGLELDGWDSIAFKGGSDAGVMAGSWLLKDKEGKGYVVVIQQSAESAAEAAKLATGQASLFGGIGDAMNLLAGRKK